MAHAANDENELDELQGKLGNEWVQVKNDRLRNIKTFAKQEDGKRYRSFKVEAELEGTAEAGARVLLDFENYRKWYWEVLDSKLLRKVSATEYYMYMVHRAPGGLPNRDVILHASVEPQSKTQKSLTLRVKAVPDFTEPKPPLVRMPAEDMTVKFTPLPGNKVQVEAEGYIDPGGKVPTWAINFIQRSAPYSVMVGLQRMIRLDEYAKARTPLPFTILDPNN
ncbi:START domain-containing protein [Fluviicoccus keumensis]|nr:START domain-containing protein [Fluviicoccus keumensis]